MYYLQDIGRRQTTQNSKKHKLCNMTKFGLSIPFTDVLKKHTKAVLWKTNNGLFYWVLWICSPADPMIYKKLFL
jgi:hypothetical protein